MKIGLLHLSDIHFNEKNAQTILNYVPKINDSVNSCKTTIDSLLVLITGDIAYAGTQSEYALADKFISALQNQIQQTMKIEAQIFVIPGNHDIDFTQDDKSRKTLREAVIKNPDACDESFFKKICEPFSSFSKFSKKYNAGKGFDQFLLHQIYVLNFEGIAFEIVAANSAWLCDIEDEPGRATILPKILPLTTNPDYRVLMLHHPIHWHIPHEGRALTDLCLSKVDIVLSGHEHRLGSFSVVDHVTEQMAEFIECGPLGPHGGEAVQFNYIEIDTSTKDIAVIQNTFDQDEKIFRSADRTILSSLRAKNERRARFSLDPDFNEFLSEMTIALQHPYKERIFLEDLFVCPDFEKIENSADAQRSSSIRSESALQEIDNLKYSMVSGIKESGKTAIAKSFFKYLWNTNRVPIYLNGSDLSHRYTDDEKFKNLVNSTAEQQYSKYDRDHFWQLDKTTRFLIIDDFHLSSLNTKGRAKIAELANTYFGGAIIFADEILKYEDLLAPSDEGEIFDSYNNLTIRPLGRRLRDQIIKRWLCLGRELSLPEEQRIRFQEQLLNRLDSILESKTIQSHPIYVLVLLQQIEADTPSAAMSGSHGNLYRFLIQKELTRHFSTLALSTEFEAYLAHIAYKFFEADNKLDQNDFARAHSEFCEEFGSKLRIDQILPKLIESGILLDQNGTFSVKRRYYISYFASMYFSKMIGLNPEESRTEIKSLLDKCYLEDVTNFLVCLTYHSNDPLLTDEVLKYSQNLLAGHEPFNFDSHVDFVKEFDRDIINKVLQIPSGNSTERRETSLREEEDLSEKHFTKKHDENSQKNDNASVSITLNTSMKIVHLLGQMIRSNQGRVPRATQTTLTKECFALGLRSLNYLVSLVEERKEEFLSASETFLKKAEKDVVNLEENAKKFFYLIIQAISAGYIDRISHSVGATELDLIFEDVRKEENQYGFILIDFFIALSYKNSVPVDQIESLSKDFENKHFPFDCLRLLVTRHINFNPIGYKDRQRVSQHLRLTNTAIQKSITKSVKE